MVRTALVVARTITFQHRAFSTTSPSRASILFALSSLSNSRETQHFNKISRLPRVEHSPSLKLIKTSEIDTFESPSASPENPALDTNPTTNPLLEDVIRSWDREALNIGRAVIADHARQAVEMKKALDEMRQREVSREESIAQEREAWQKESRHLRNEIRVAGVWILVSIGTATGLATWRFWPQGGNKIAAASPASSSTSTTATAPVAVSVSEPGMTATGLRAKEVVVPASKTVAVTQPVVDKTAVTPVNVISSEMGDTSSWWKSLFWKQA